LPFTGSFSLTVANLSMGRHSSYLRGLELELIEKSISQEGDGEGDGEVVARVELGNARLHGLPVRVSQRQSLSFAI
jgi:hypothetical protein